MHETIGRRRELVVDITDEQVATAGCAQLALEATEIGTGACVPAVCIVLV